MIRAEWFTLDVPLETALRISQGCVHFIVYAAFFIRLDFNHKSKSFSKEFAKTKIV